MGLALESTTFDYRDVLLIGTLADFSRWRFFHDPAYFKHQLNVREYVHQLQGRKPLLLATATDDPLELEFGQAAQKQTVQRYGVLKIRYSVKTGGHRVESDNSVTHLKDGYEETVTFRNYFVRVPAFGVWSIQAKDVSVWTKKL